MGVVNVGMTFISLVLVERAGRKTLMIAGLCVMLVSTTMILICLVAAVSQRFLFKSRLHEQPKSDQFALRTSQSFWVRWQKFDQVRPVCVKNFPIIFG
jgi:MFS family permease